jgi:glycosyltransferase involved in cell wall biosynthesis
VSERARPDPISSRTAIVHDWFQGLHGAERVVEAIRSGLFPPDNPPDIYTFYAARELLPPPLAAAIARESRIGRLPGFRQTSPGPGGWRYLLPYMPWYFRRLSLAGYELVISSSHTFALSVRPPAGAVHICYCHTPNRYAWSPRVSGDRARALLLQPLRQWFRRIDFDAAQRPDSFVANSEATRARIARLYGRDAVVIHPPVDVQEFTPADKQAGRFLWVHRLVPHKHPELVAEAFRGLPHRLTMVGVGMLEGRVRAKLPPNVELLGWVGHGELVSLYARAVGFVHVGEEDFGISMVEALASGTPVIGLDRGGAREIVRHGIDGLLIPRPEVGLLREAIEELAARRWDPAVLAARARDFSTERFLSSFREHLATLGVP